MKLGERIKQARQARGLSQKVVADRANISTKALGFIERSESEDPKLSSIEGIAEAMGLTIEELVGKYTEQLNELYKAGKIQLRLIDSRQQWIGDIEPNFLHERVAKQLLLELENEAALPPRVFVGTRKEAGGTSVGVYLEAIWLDRDAV